MIDYLQFRSLFLETLNNMAPFKMEVLRFNNNSLMNKSLGKAIMVRSRLKYKFNRNCSGENGNSY